MIWIILASLAVLLIVAYMVYTVPDTPVKIKRKAKKEQAGTAVPNVEQKNWQEIAQRWEKNNNALLGDIEKIKSQEKKILKDIEEYKAKNKDLLDKLSLEKGWREKEQLNVEKSKAHEKDLKGQITRTEGDLEREHSARLRLEREGQELKVKYDAVVEEKRIAATNASSLKATVDELSVQLKDLKRENQELKKKREDIQWVAKSEFDELARQFNKLKAQAGV